MVKRRAEMMERNLVGVANCVLASLDLFPRPEWVWSMAIPRELAESRDPDLISSWAQEKGWIGKDQVIAVIDT